MSGDPSGCQVPRYGTYTNTEIGQCTMSRHVVVLRCLLCLGAIALVSLGAYAEATPCGDCYWVPVLPIEISMQGGIILAAAVDSYDPRCCPGETWVPAHQHYYMLCRQMTKTVQAGHVCDWVIPYDDTSLEHFGPTEGFPLDCGECFYETLLGIRTTRSNGHWKCTANPGWECKKETASDRPNEIDAYFNNCGTA